MLAQANMPNSFWAPAMKATAYLRNRLLRSALNDEIPYEHWSHGNSLQKKTSNYSNHLAASYMGQCSLPKDNRKKHCGNKLFDHGTKGCLIGYVSSSTYSYYDF
jgi:hypothetical protein